MKKILAICSLLVFGIGVKGQESGVKNPPINMEAMPAHNGIVMQMLINKKLMSVPRLGIFSVTSLISEWNENKLTDFMNQSSLTYEITKGFNITGGYHYTVNTGFRGTVGAMYTYADKNWLVVIYPRVDLADNGNFEGFGMVEYKPKINDTFNLYTRIQGLYAFTMKDQEMFDSRHQRSYLVARAGLSYKEFAFGLGANVDFFGPMKHNVNNFGVFLSANLF